jgi:hypothetical protein
MRRWLAGLAGWYRARRRTPVHVVGAQSLGPGIAVYALDVDGRRIIFAASSQAICILDKYPAPPDQQVERDQCAPLAKSCSA